MSLKRRKIVRQMIDVGWGTQTIPADSGGTLTGDKVGLHSFSEYINVKHVGAAGNLVTDDTSAIQTALDNSLSVYIDGTFKITSALTLRSGHHIWLSPQTTIRQFTIDTNIFTATSKDSVWIEGNGAVLYGEGSWSASWTGVQGHEDRGIQFLGCTRSGVSNITVKNCAACGIAIIGGSDIRLIAPHVEGTNSYSTTLSSGNNHQHGIYISNHATYGAADRITIVSPNVSGTAQGILREEQTATPAGGSTSISNPVIHDIPGQHAFYFQTGYVSVSNPNLARIAFAGVKVQSGSSNRDIKSVTVTGVSAYDVGTNLFELASVGTGSVYDVLISGAGDKIGYTGGYGLAISQSSTGVVKNVKADLVLTDCKFNAALIQNDGHKEIDIDLFAKDIGEDAVFITATNASNIRIRPVIREANTSVTSAGSGIRVNSASASVIIQDPDITDANSNMVYGIYNQLSGSTVKVRGSVNISGASAYAVRAIGAITEFPTEAHLSGTSGTFNGLDLVTSSQSMFSSVQSTSASNVTLWQMALADNTTYWIEASMVSLLSTGAQRSGIRSGVLVYRAGGGAVVESYTADYITDTDGGVIGTYNANAVKSSGFGGVFAWIASGNNINLQVNSGGSATYNWKALVRVVSTT